MGQQQEQVKRRKTWRLVGEMDGFDWDSAVVNSDNRHDEKRWTAIGYIGDRLYVVVFALRGEKVRVISLRKANEREQKRYLNV
ncbi:MAG: BrnT family toxin [Thalassospira sp.]|uniref:BrnT family toxin n=1 Tax=Thalassospira sp. TaxID=1912094 RepID=UPI0032EF7DAA